MNCRTQSCGFESPDGDFGRRYCERCGWPLAKAHVDCRPDTINFAGMSKATLTVRVHNENGGTLQWALGDLPAGVRKLNDENPATSGNPSTVDLEIDPAIVTSDALAFDIRLYDRVGEHRNDLRTASLGDLFRSERIEVPLVRRRKGPLVCNWQTLVFGHKGKSHAITLQNQGDTTLPIRMRTEGQYTVGIPGTPPTNDLTTELLPLERRHVTVTRTGAISQGNDDGVLKVEPEDLPHCTVALVPVPPPPPRATAERYLIAIDFGTSKSAVMVLDQRFADAEPQPVLWEHNDEKKRWLPSVVALEGWANPADRVPRRFGWEVGDTEEGPNIIRGLKTRLRDNDAIVNDCVDFFLRRIFAQIDAQFSDENVFGDCRIVVTLPVLDNGPLFDEQKNVTVELVARAARDFRVDASAIHTAREPECAAYDFLHAMQKKVAQDPSGKMIQPGEWLCILDMGGGTTDVTFAQLDVDASGIPTFDRMHSLGYPVAGDTVDREMFKWCLGEWKKKGRLKPSDKAPAKASPTTDELADAQEVHLDGEPFGLPRNEAIQMVRVLKEGIYRSDTPVAQKWDSFKQVNQLTLSAQDIRPTLQTLARRMFILGEGQFPSVQTAMERTFRLRARDVSLLCLTGGTSNISDFKQLLRESVLNIQSMRELVTREEIRLNVVRGAARSGVVNVAGRLPFDVRVELNGKPWKALDSGVVPGVAYKETVHCVHGQDGQIKVTALLPDRPPMILYSRSIPHDSEDGLNLEVTMEYTAQKQLKLLWRWLTAGDPPVAFEIIQTVPST